MIKIKNNTIVDFVSIAEIKVGTVFTGRIEDLEDNLFLKICDEIVSLNNPEFTLCNPNCVVKGFREVDIEIAILQKREYNDRNKK